MNSWLQLYKWAIRLLILLTITGMVFLFLPQFRKIRELQRRKSALTIENQNIEQETKKIRLKRERFKTEPEFVERVARESGRVKSDEVVFKFTSSQDEKDD